MKIRRHRETLSEAMKTVLDIEPTIEAIREYLGTPLGHIKVEYYGFDTRIGWDTYIVTIDGKAIAFTNSMVK